jgi:hypothetical protein
MQQSTYESLVGVDLQFTTQRKIKVAKKNQHKFCLELCFIGKQVGASLEISNAVFAICFCGCLTEHRKTETTELPAITAKSTSIHFGKMEV